MKRFQKPECHWQLIMEHCQGRTRGRPGYFIEQFKHVFPVLMVLFLFTALDLVLFHVNDKSMHPSIDESQRWATASIHLGKNQQSALG
eukprot:1139496-Pelagomonas_calceolata.AAC.7